jgi:hypothetical protein
MAATQKCIGTYDVAYSTQLTFSVPCETDGFASLVTPVIINYKNRHKHKHNIINTTTANIQYKSKTKQTSAAGLVSD